MDKNLIILLLNKHKVIRFVFAGLLYRYAFSKCNNALRHDTFRYGLSFYDITKSLSVLFTPAFIGNTDLCFTKMQSGCV